MALTKAYMAEKLYEELGLNKREAKELVEAFFEEVRAALEAGVTTVVVAGGVAANSRLRAFLCEAVPGPHRFWSASCLRSLAMR